MVKTLKSPIIFIGLALVTLECLAFPLFADQGPVPLARTPGQPPPFVLVGVVVAAEPSSSVAVLRRGPAGPAAIVRVGERIKGFDLIQVSAEGAVLSDGKKSLRLFLERRSEGPVSEAPPPMAAEAAAPQVSPSLSPAAQPLVEKEFDRNEIIKRIREELPKIMQEARWAPHFTSEGIDGLQVIKLPFGSQLLSDVGIREGDIILQINNIRLNHPSALGRLREAALVADRFEVVVEREGQVGRLSYALKGPGR